MHPRLTTLHFHNGSWPIGSYGVLLVLALGAGSWLALRRGKRAGLEEGALISSVACAVAGGFVGAFVVSVGVRFVQLGSLSSALAQPGIVFFGALLGGAVALAAAARGFGLPVLETLEAMLPALPVAHAIGRIGCFFGGCCFGAHSELPWAVHYPGESLARHPWPLYEAAALSVLAVLFWTGPSRAPGQRVMLYVLAYACVRLLLEPLRGDSARGVFGALALSTSQIIAACLIAVSALAAARPRIERLLNKRTETRDAVGEKTG
jgi:phosphatidylglycerol:prolipoprotein diacylglycerol transferase